MLTCFFDIDGTLLRTGGAGQAAMESALAAEFGFKFPVKGIAFAGRTDRAIVHDLFTYFDVQPDEENWLRFMESYLRHLPKSLAERDGLVLPGVGDILAKLAQRGDVLLGLLTGNFREGARTKLDHYDLFDYFRFGGFGDVHHHRDDVAREAYADAVRHHGDSLNRDRCWVIGDTPADVQCGRAIDANVVAVATGTYTLDELAKTRPDHLFEDFGEPAELLELLSS